MLDRDSRIGVLGGGAMGSGIAQVAAAAGHAVVLADVSEAALERGLAGILKVLARDVDKGRCLPADAEAIAGRISTAVVDGHYSAFEGCDLVVEAIVEDLAAKQQAFTALEGATGPAAVLATNTSSLSVTAIAAPCQHPERVVGVHFFNPAPVMPLVEIIGGHATDPALLGRVRELLDAWGKTTVIAADTPGFIVNRVARPFYGEALRLYEEGVAEPATIDWAMRELGGFRMGPFELMDLIGNDVNYAVTRSIFEAFYYDPRYRPSLIQKRLVDARLFGRKSGHGYYDHRPGARPVDPVRDEAAGRRIVDRILAMLINEAADAVFLRVATAADVDLAMTRGVNYPKGLLHWADEIGLPEVLARLEALHDEYGEDRYRPCPLLRRMAREGRTFFG
ncbi:MAG: 3-hydroxybutyryl-CoA dehydrogenase [Gemmatimonadetes bacterium]|nr:3-hydroxybutyryl-CoA dehydrogenase [Gemmatimonadota bacterium]